MGPGDYYPPRFCVYSVVNSIAGIMLVQCVFVDLFPCISYAGALLSNNKGFLVNLILQTSLDCFLTLFILISDMCQFVPVHSVLL